MKKIAALVETTGDRATAVKSGSTVFSVQQQQRAVSADEEFCVQIRNKACHKAPAKVITMNVSGGNSKEIFELFTNKLVFSVSVSQRWRIRWWSWLAISSLDSPLERSASSRIIMKLLRLYSFNRTHSIQCITLNFTLFLFIALLNTIPTRAPSGAVSHYMYYSKQLLWIEHEVLYTSQHNKVLSIWFISLSSNLKLSIYIFIMSVRHVFADFRFIFVKCSCSRRDGTSLFSLFYKIILYIQGSRLRPKCDHFLRVCE